MTTMPKVFPEWTTAMLRNAAMEAEKNLQWGRAIDLWQSAMDNYQPRPLTLLGRKEVDAMHARQANCVKTYFPR